jgi:AcrR family transcriptional regulator
VTMRRVATALDTGAASLYVYVRDTEDLHAEILDALLGSIGASVPPDGTWRDRLKGLLIRYMQVLFEHPEIARMAISTQPSGPHFFALVDTILALLREGGVPDREAAWAVDLLLLFATATAVEHGPPRRPSQTASERSALAAEIATSGPQRYPEIARLGDELLSGTGPDRFEWGIDVILAGSIAARRAPDHRDSGENAP